MNTKKIKINPKYTYDCWVNNQKVHNIMFNWCQYCVHNNKGDCVLYNKNVDDDGCCKDCVIDNKKIEVEE